MHVHIQSPTVYVFAVHESDNMYITGNVGSDSHGEFVVLVQDVKNLSQFLVITSILVDGQYLKNGREKNKEKTKRGKEGSTKEELNKIQRVKSYLS